MEVNKGKCLFWTSIMILVLPMLTAGAVSWNLIPGFETDNDWISFFGSYFGAIIGAAVALMVVKISLIAEKTEQMRIEKNKVCSEIIMEVAEFDELAACLWMRAQDLAKLMLDKKCQDKDISSYLDKANRFLQCKMILLIKLNDDQMIESETLLTHVNKISDIVERFDINYQGSKGCVFKGDVINVTNDLMEETSKTEQLLKRYYKINHKQN